MLLHGLEESKMNKLTLAWIAAVALLAGSWGAYAASVSGKIVGYECAHDGHECPTDNLDPHVALEPDFVVVKDDGSYIFIPNVPRATKVRYVLQDVKVSGEVNEKLNFVNVDELMVDGKTVWSPKTQQDAAKALWSGEALN